MFAGQRRHSQRAGGALGGLERREEVGIVHAQAKAGVGAVRIDLQIARDLTPELGERSESCQRALEARARALATDIDLPI